MEWIVPLGIIGALFALLIWWRGLEGAHRIIDIVLGIICCCTIYLLPTGLALLRNRANNFWLFILNLFCGMFVIPWLIALFMVFSGEKVWTKKDEDKAIKENEEDLERIMENRMRDMD